MIGGMLAATVLAILFVPVFFVLIARRPPKRGGRSERGTRSPARTVEERAAHA